MDINNNNQSINHFNNILNSDISQPEEVILLESIYKTDKEQASQIIQLLMMAVVASSNDIELHKQIIPELTRITLDENKSNSLLKLITGTTYFTRHSMSEHFIKYLRNLDRDDLQELKSYFITQRSILDMLQQNNIMTQHQMRDFNNINLTGSGGSLDSTSTKIKKQLTKVGYLYKNKLPHKCFVLGITQNANLSYFNLSSSRLQSLNLKDAQLINANLNEVECSNVQMYHANLTGAKLSWARLENVNMEKTNLTNANLTKATLIKVKLRGTNFKDAILRETTISLQFTALPTLLINLDIDFNHINNPDSGSILTAIESIDNKYKELKINLMHQVITYLEDKSIHSIQGALENILVNNEIYFRDHKCYEFIVERLLAPVIQHANYQSLQNISESKIISLFKMVNYLNNTQLTHCFINYNNFFIQLIYHGLNVQKNYIPSVAQEFYEEYLKVSPIKQVKNYYESESIDCWIDNPFEQGNKPHKNYKLIFHSTDQNKQYALAVDIQYLDKFYSDNLTEQNRFQLFECEGEKDNTTVKYISNPDLEKTFRIFSIFKDNKLFAENKVAFIKLIDILELKTEHKNMFLAAINYHHLYPEKLVNDKAQSDLANSINKLFSNHNEKGDIEELCLNNTAYNSIIDNFKLNDKLPQIKAQVLLVLSGVFMYYSSSKIFGTELDSPQIIRNLAYALMKKAHDLDASIFPNDNENSYDEWTSRLLGLNNAFTCTAVASYMVFKHCKRSFPEIANQFIPPAWH